jgi:hypothetical protein
MSSSERKWKIAPKPQLIFFIEASIQKFPKHPKKIIILISYVLLWTTKVEKCLSTLY